MGIIPISSVTNPTAAVATKPKNELDKDGFMKLLLAQLKNQNPMEPSDPSAFMAQTSQMTMVDKLEQMAASSAATLQAQQSLTATTMVGRQITWNDDDGNPVSGIVSSAKFGTAGANLVVGTGSTAKTIALGKVLSVSTPPVAAPTPPTAAPAPAPAAPAPAPAPAPPAPAPAAPAPAPVPGPAPSVSSSQTDPATAAMAGLSALASAGV